MLTEEHKRIIKRTIQVDIFKKGWFDLSDHTHTCYEIIPEDIRNVCYDVAEEIGYDHYYNIFRNQVTNVKINVFRRK